MGFSVNAKDKGESLADNFTYPHAGVKFDTHSSNSDISEDQGSVLIRVYGYVNRTWTPIIIDSGGSTSVMSTRVYDNLKVQGRLKNSDRSFHTIGQDVNSRGRLRTSIEIGSYKTKWSFELVEDENPTVILG